MMTISMLMSPPLRSHALHPLYPLMLLLPCIILLQQVSLTQSQRPEYSFDRFEGIVESLHSRGLFSIPPTSTVFAPDNDAFTSVGGSTPRSSNSFFLQPPSQLFEQEEWSQHAVYVLGHHIIEGKELATVEFQELPVETSTLSNTTLTLFDATVGTEFGGTTILSSNLRPYNPQQEGNQGLWHVISAILIPPTLQHSVKATLQQDKQFSILLELLQKTSPGLMTLLDQHGPLTLLAPTNEAFEKAGGDDFVQMLHDNPVFAKVFLVHHVLNGNVYDFGLEVSTMNSVLPSTLFSYPIDSTEAGTVGLNHAVVQAKNRVLCHNGVLHPLVQNVLLPPSIPHMLQNVHLLTELSVRLDSMAHALETARFLDDLDYWTSPSSLNHPTPLTVLSPTNEAMASESMVQKFVANSDAWALHLKLLLRHHILPTKFSARDLPNTPTTLAGTTLDVTKSTVSAGAVTSVSIKSMNTNSSSSTTSTTTTTSVESSTITVQDIYVYNATIQVLDTVLIPPTLTKNIYEHLQQDETDLFASLLEKVLLNELLSDDEDSSFFTVFVPSSAALQKLATTDLIELRDILEHHIVPGINFVASSKDSQSLLPTMLPGLPLTVVQSESTTDIVINSVVKVAAATPLLCSNGIVYFLEDDDSILSLPDHWTRMPTPSPSMTPTRTPVDEVLQPVQVFTVHTKPPTSSSSSSAMTTTTMSLLLLLLVALSW